MSSTRTRWAVIGSVIGFILVYGIVRFAVVQLQTDLKRLSDFGVASLSEVQRADATESSGTMLEASGDALSPAAVAAVAEDEAAVDTSEVNADAPEEGTTAGAQAVGLEAAAPQSPLPTPDSSAFESPLSAFDSPLMITDTPAPGTGGLAGRVFNTGLDGTRKPFSFGPARLATVFVSDQTGEEFFALSGATSPGADLDGEGIFLFNNLEPGRYVLIIGDVIGHHRIILEPDGQATVYTVDADEILDVGTLDVDLPLP